jgi:hypothetical protein
LEKVTDEYLGRVNSALASSDEFSEYVAELEEADAVTDGIDPDQTAGLLSEIEDYLRRS